MSISRLRWSSQATSSPPEPSRAHVGANWPAPPEITVAPSAVQSMPPTAVTFWAKMSGVACGVAKLRWSSQTKNAPPPPSGAASPNSGSASAAATSVAPVLPHCWTPRPFSRWAWSETPGADSSHATIAPPSPSAMHPINPCEPVVPGTAWPPAVHWPAPPESRRCPITLSVTAGSFQKSSAPVPPSEQIAGDDTDVGLVSICRPLVPHCALPAEFSRCA
jgi:hypothetical protein